MKTPDETSTLERAKELYFNYLGSPFFMSQGGVEQEYLSYGVSKTQEALWHQELMEFWINKLSSTDNTALEHLRDMRAVEALPSILKVSPEGDSWMRLRFAEDLWSIVKNSRSSRSHRRTLRRSRRKAIAILQSLLGPSTVPVVPPDVLRTSAHGDSCEDYFRERVLFNLRQASPTTKTMVRLSTFMRRHLTTGWK